MEFLNTSELKFVKITTIFSCYIYALYIFPNLKNMTNNNFIYQITVMISFSFPGFLQKFPLTKG